MTAWSLAVCRLGAPGTCRWPVGFGWPHWIPRPPRLDQQCEVRPPGSPYSDDADGHTWLDNGGACRA